MTDLLLDLRYACRRIVKSPGLSLVIVLTLTLGIGANTVIFSVANGVLLRPLPFRDPDRLLELRYAAAPEDLNSSRFSVPELFEFRRQSRTLASLSEYHTMTFTLLGWGEPLRVKTGVVSAEFFDTLGIKPYLGRTFRPGEDRLGGAPALVLTYDFWRRRLLGDPAVLGKALQMNGLSLTVVGVLPPLPQFPGEDDLYATVPACPNRSDDRLIHERSAYLLNLFGRLRPRVTLEQAQAEVATIARRLSQEFPQHYGGVRAANVTLVPVPALLVSEIRPTLLILWATVGIVLLIACANLANLTLAQLIRRERELVLRASLGAGRGRLIRQLLTENVMLSLLGGTLGLVLAAASSDLFIAFARLFTPRVQDIRIDTPVLVFTLLVSVLTGIGFGLVPAFQMTRSNLSTSLKEGGPSTLGTTRRRFYAALIVAQVALSFVLLIGAGLMVRSLVELQRVYIGNDPAKVLTVRVVLPFTTYTEPKSRQFFQRLLEEVQRHPQVRSAALGTRFPLYGDQAIPSVRIEGQPTGPHQELAQADWVIVSPEYFKTLGIALLRGRMFEQSDSVASQPVTVISRSMARRHWPGQSPLGRRLSCSIFGDGVWFTVIGVVDDIRQAGVNVEPNDTFYVSYLQQGDIEMSVLARTAGDPAILVNDIRRAVHTLDPAQPVADIQTLMELRNRSIAPSRLTAVLLIVSALLAFSIAALGLGAVVAFVVGQRTPEIGLRLALGAERNKLLAMVLRQGMTLMVLGLGLGWATALAGSRLHLLSTLLFRTQPADPLTFVSASLVLLVCGSAACFFPACRAASIDPVTALRS